MSKLYHCTKPEYKECKKVQLDTMFLLHSTLAKSKGIKGMPKEPFKKIISEDKIKSEEKIFKKIRKTNLSPFVSMISVGELVNKLRYTFPNDEHFSISMGTFVNEVFTKYKIDIYHPKYEFYDDIATLHKEFINQHSIHYNDGTIIAHAITDPNTEVLLTNEPKIIYNENLISRIMNYRELKNYEPFSISDGI